MTQTLTQAAQAFAPAFDEAKAAAELALLHGATSLTMLLQARLENGVGRSVGARAIDDIMAGNAAMQEGLKHYLNAQRRLAGTRDELSIAPNMVGDWSDCPPDSPPAAIERDDTVRPFIRAA